MRFDNQFSSAVDCAIETIPRHDMKNEFCLTVISEWRSGHRSAFLLSQLRDYEWILEFRFMKRKALTLRPSAGVGETG
jgi:hypothetical protein